MCFKDASPEADQFLKQQLRVAGLNKYVTEDKREKWDEKYISEMYQKYVFYK